MILQSSHKVCRASAAVQHVNTIHPEQSYGYFLYPWTSENLLLLSNIHSDAHLSVVPLFLYFPLFPLIRPAELTWIIGNLHISIQTCSHRCFYVSLYIKRQNKITNNYSKFSCKKKKDKFLSCKSDEKEIILKKLSDCKRYSYYQLFLWKLPCFQTGLSSSNCLPIWSHF